MDKLLQVKFSAIPTPSFDKDVWNLESPIRTPVEVPVNANYLVFEVYSAGPGTISISQTSRSNHSLSTVHPTVDGKNRIIVPVLVQISHMFIDSQPWLVLAAVEAGVPEEDWPFVPCVAAKVFQRDSLVRNATNGQYEFRTRLETMSVTVIPEEDCLGSIVSQFGVRFAVPGYSGVLLGRARFPLAAEGAFTAILPPKNFLAVGLERNDKLTKEDYLLVM